MEKDFCQLSGANLQRGTVYHNLDQVPDYKQFFAFLGSSDIAQLTMVGIVPDEGAVPFPLKFGADGIYKAWIQYSKGPAEVPSHYRLIKEYTTWLKVYDDRFRTFDIMLDGAKISVYRSGCYGCIICIEDYK
jgi:hypothetical protein